MTHTTVFIVVDSNEKKFRLFVSKPTGETVALRLTCESTISEILTVLSQLEDIRVHQLRLIFAGERLDHGDTLSDYDIPRESVLDLFYEQTGGMYAASSGRSDFLVLGGELPSREVSVRYGPSAALSRKDWRRIG